MEAQAFFLLQYDVVRTLVDELLLAEQSDEQLRQPLNEEHHSLVWLLWHTTRWEDIAMTMLLEGTHQVLEQKDWLSCLGVADCALAFHMDVEELRHFNASINIAALYEYRASVEQHTQEVLSLLREEELEALVPEMHFRQVLNTGMMLDQRTFWLERFLADRSRVWWLSFIIWQTTTHLLSECMRLRPYPSQLYSWHI